MGVLFQLCDGLVARNASKHEILTMLVQCWRKNKPEINLHAGILCPDTMGMLKGSCTFF